MYYVVLHTILTLIFYVFIRVKINNLLISNFALLFLEILNKNDSNVLKNRSYNPKTYIK